MSKPTIEELDAILNDPTPLDVVVLPDGQCGVVLKCGHDVSNRDTALESGTVFCRLCDLESRCRDAEKQEKELFQTARDNKDAYIGACKLVADMHAAAMGEVCGPRLGVVEDVAELKAKCDLMEKHRAYLIQACNRVIHSRKMDRDLASNLNEAVGIVTGNV